MTPIQVSSSLARPGSSLALHSCAGCGRHAWERDGVELDRDAVLGVVRERIAEVPPKRVLLPRRPRIAAPKAVDRRELDVRLASFSIPGQ